MRKEFVKIKYLINIKILAIIFINSRFIKKYKL